MSTWMVISRRTLFAALIGAHLAAPVAKVGPKVSATGTRLWIGGHEMTHVIEPLSCSIACETTGFMPSVQDVSQRLASLNPEPISFETEVEYVDREALGRLIGRSGD